MSSSNLKSDEYPPPLYRQDGFSSKVGYFKAAQAYKHAIPSRIHVKRVKDDNGHEPCNEHASARKRAIKFHLYYFVLGFTFPMPRLFQEVFCSIKCASAHCSPNAVHAMVGFSNLNSLTLLLRCVSRLPLSVWRWLLSLLRQEKGGLPPKEEIKRIKDEALTRPIVAKIFSLPTCESLVQKKPMTLSAARGSSSAAKKLIIDLTFPNGAKMILELEPLKPTTLKSGAKSGFASKRLAAMKSGKVDYTAKVVSRLAPPSAMTDSSAEKGKSAHMGSSERSTESEVREFPEVCALLKANLLKDVDACAKFINSVGKVVIRSDAFAKRPTYSSRSSLIATMHKTLILAAKVALVAQLRSAAKKIENLESELIILKRSDVFAPTSLQLEIAHQEVSYLNARLSTTQVMLEAAKKEISHVSPVLENLKRVNSELRFACFAKDEELILMHVDVSRLKKVASKLESREIDLQSVLSASENLRKELDELQDAHTRLVDENVQIKNEKVSHEVALASYQANFYKLGYFSKKDFKTFSISPVDLLNFSFEAAFGGAAEGQAVQAEAAKDELMEALIAGNGTAAEGVAVEEPMVAQTAKKTGSWVSCFKEAVDPTSSLRY
ncbi:S ribonuclease [Pyrus ussuriensis x Pyrus communis]|uniref:S ribonuclease n=1 Tax=Pyrus ussuriensis x Pyrus communis TaxID=2448454 RepID=A0A5N5HSR0_9ROSA|nr:S ribonuclease [Pyrus ussuriensis x Pyrus communis]